MSNVTIRDSNALVTSPNWGAIWGGVFTFFAIWCVFGLLGMSLLERNTAGSNIAMGTWAIILMIISMYVAGRTTGHLAAVSTPRDGMMYGMIMFGLSVVGALAITVLAGASARVTNAAGEHTPYLLGVFGDLGWFGFLSLFFGWLAAMGGASQGTHVIHTSIPHASHAA